MNIIFLSIFFFLINQSEVRRLEFHNFHLSRCEINYETSSGDIQVAAHIFIDDLESALAQMGKKDLYLFTEKESKKAEEAIEYYLNQKLIFKSYNKILKLSLIGKESSKDRLTVWCYLEIKGIKNLSAVGIENNILIDFFNDQKNIVDFTVDKKKKHFTIFDSKKISEVYKW